jgi:hypothetical protein
MIKLRYPVAILAVGLGLYMGGVFDSSKPEASEPSSLEATLETAEIQIDSIFNSREQAEINEVARQIDETFERIPDFTLIKAGENFHERVRGAAYHDLGSNFNQLIDFTEIFSPETYEEFRGRNVVVLEDFDRQTAWVNDNDLSSSCYMPNPNPTEIYQRAVAHEIGHIIFNDLKEKYDLVNRLFEVDLKYDLDNVEDRTCHPGHTSYDTFFFVGSEVTAGLGWQGRNASEVFADIFALYTLGYIDENVKDEALKEKIGIVTSALEDLR